MKLPSFFLEIRLGFGRNISFRPFISQLMPGIYYFCLQNFLSPVTLKVSKLLGPIGDQQKMTEIVFVHRCENDYKSFAYQDL